jgi:predicted esterase
VAPLAYTPGMRCARALAVLPVLLAAAAAAQDAAPAPPAEEPPFPVGMSSTTLEGLRCSIVMPEGWSSAKGCSLVFVLHGNGGTETDMAGSLQFLAADGFAVVAPKARALGWDHRDDQDAARRIAADCAKRLKVPPGRLHALGFSNGGWNLPAVAFDESAKYASFCWVAAGFRGGSVPKYAKKESGALALAGADDGNRAPTEKTPDLLEGKVRSAEYRLQPGLGHEWPGKLMPYYRWWLLVQEGRFVPGDCAAFEWSETEEAARAAMAARKVGAFAYLFDPAQAADPVAKALQNDLLRDPMVQRFGSQLPCWKAERAAAAALADAAKVKAPAVVVLDASGKVSAALQGKVTAQALAAALRTVAPDKSLPKR